MSDYNIFAKYYDELMYDVNYEETGDFILEFALKYGVAPPALTVDLGCGTGKMCRYFSKKGFDMIGIDLSFEMLSVAKENTADGRILYLNQDMTDFELYGTVAMITCLTDGVNHITDSRLVKRMFGLAFNYLDYNGVFVFDINSEEKLANVMGNNVFYEIGDDVSYVWQSSYNKRSKICDFDLTFFIKNEDGSYRKSEAFIREKVYLVEDLKKWLADVGFQKIKVVKKGLRVYFICAKPNILNK